MVKIICETSNGLYSIQSIKDISINDLEESPISENIYQKPDVFTTFIQKFILEESNHLNKSQWLYMMS